MPAENPGIFKASSPQWVHKELLGLEPRGVVKGEPERVDGLTDAFVTLVGKAVSGSRAAAAAPRRPGME